MIERQFLNNYMLGEKVRMKNSDIIIRGENISLRLIKASDKEEYYKTGFESFDEEVELYTGTKHVSSKEEIMAYVERNIKDDTRYDFLMINSNDEIIGESVINEIDTDIRCANFRIAIFNSKNFGQGIGSEAIKMTVKFAFEELKLHRIELEVFSFNERAYKAYCRAGFIEEGRRRDGEFINGQYCDVIIMSILENEYRSN